MKKAILLVIIAIYMMILNSLLAEASQTSKDFVLKFELGDDFKSLLESDFLHSDNFNIGVEKFGKEELNRRLDIYLPKRVSKYQEQWNTIVEKEYLKVLSEKEISSLVTDAEKSAAYSKFIKTKSEIEKRYRYITMTSADYIQASTHFDMYVLLATD